MDTATLSPRLREIYDREQFAPGSRGARGFCSHPRCKEEPKITLVLARGTGGAMRRGLCAEHAARIERLATAS